MKTYLFGTPAGDVSIIEQQLGNLGITSGMVGSVLLEFKLLAPLSDQSARAMGLDDDAAALCGITAV